MPLFAKELLSLHPHRHRRHPTVIVKCCSLLGQLLFNKLTIRITHIDVQYYDLRFIPRQQQLFLSGCGWLGRKAFGKLYKTLKRFHFMPGWSGVALNDCFVDEHGAMQIHLIDTGV